MSLNLEVLCGLDTVISHKVLGVSHGCGHQQFKAEFIKEVLVQQIVLVNAIE